MNRLKAGFFLWMICVSGLLTACGNREAGLTLSLSLALEHPAVTVDGAGWHFTRANGDRVVLSRGYLTLASVEILPCPTLGERLWQTLSPFGVAYAHTVGSPTLLGTPHVVGLGASLTAPALSLGELHPPPASYCHAHLVFEPADDDAEGLPSDVSMVGRTLLLEGTVTSPSEGTPRPFHLESAETAEVDVSLTPATLDQKSQTAARGFTLSPSKWLDGVDLSLASAAAQTLATATASAAAQP